MERKENKGVEEIAELDRRSFLHSPQEIESRRCKPLGFFLW